MFSHSAHLVFLRECTLNLNWFSIQKVVMLDLHSYPSNLQTPCVYLLKGVRSNCRKYGVYATYSVMWSHLSWLYTYLLKITLFLCLTRFTKIIYLISVTSLQKVFIFIMYKSACKRTLGLPTKNETSETTEQNLFTPFSYIHGSLHAKTSFFSKSENQNQIIMFEEF